MAKKSTRTDPGYAFHRDWGSRIIWNRLSITQVNDKSRRRPSAHAAPCRQKRLASITTLRSVAEVTEEHSIAAVEGRSLENRTAAN